MDAADVSCFHRRKLCEKRLASFDSSRGLLAPMLVVAEATDVKVEDSAAI